jgi:hypothetical protein
VRATASARRRCLSVSEITLPTSDQKKPVSVFSHASMIGSWSGVPFWRLIVTNSAG